jgi:hypothetical protein
MPSVLTSSTHWDEAKDALWVCACNASALEASPVIQGLGLGRYGKGIIRAMDRMIFFAILIFLLLFLFIFFISFSCSIYSFYYSFIILLLTL